MHWYSFFIPDFANEIAGDVGWILLLPALASVVVLRRREEFALFGAAIVSILLTIGPTLTPLFYKIPLYLALQFSWRFLIADLLFMAPLAGLFFWRLSLRLSASEAIADSKGKIVALGLLLLLILVPVTALYLGKAPSNYYPTQQTPADPSQKEAFDFLAKQPGFFRVMVMDRYFESFPEFTLKGSTDGWYDQATTPAYRGFSYVVYYCGATENVLGGLRLLGARYVMVDYGYGRDATSPIQAYNSSRSVFGAPVFENNEFRIYQVPDSHLVYVSSSMPNSQLGVSQEVDCSKPIPSAPKQVNYSLENFNWTETRVSFDVSVNQSSFVFLANSYSAGWAATDNGGTAQILLSPPDFPVIKVSPGAHHVVFLYSSTPLEQVSLILSIIALGVVLALVIRMKAMKNLV